MNSNVGTKIPKIPWTRNEGEICSYCLMWKFPAIRAIPKLLHLFTFHTNLITLNELSLYQVKQTINDPTLPVDSETIAVNLTKKEKYIMFYLKIIKPAGLFIAAFVFAASMFSASTVFAQGDDGSGQKPPKDGPPPMQMDEKRSPEDMAKKMSGMLKDKLELSDEQTSQVYDIVLGYAGSHDRSNFDRKELDEKIETVLSESQKEKFHEFIKNNRQKFDHQPGPGENRTEPNNEGMKINEDLKQDDYSSPGNGNNGTENNTKQPDQMEERNRSNPEHF